MSRTHRLSIGVAGAELSRRILEAPALLAAQVDHQQPAAGVLE